MRRSPVAPLLHLLQALDAVLPCCSSFSFITKRGAAFYCCSSLGGTKEEVAGR